MNQRDGFAFALHKARGLFMVLVDDFACDALLVAPLEPIQATAVPCRRFASRHADPKRLPES